MNKLYFDSVYKASAFFFMICLAAGTAYSGIVFEADFRGPGNGTGGAYDMVTMGGHGKFLFDNNHLLFSRVVNNDPDMNGGGYFSCSITNPLSSDAFSVLGFTPNASSNSFAAMTSTVGDDIVLNGGFDFFFRSEEALTGGEMRALDVENRSNGGLRFVFTSQAPGLRLEIISNTGGMFAGSEAGSSNNFNYASGSYTFESNTVYHIGVSYETDAEGTVTAKIWCEEGTGSIDLTTATPVATISFGINEDVVTTGFSSSYFSMGQFRLGNFSSIPSFVHDYDQFRIYDSTPTYFDALDDPAVIWRASSPETVLQADFNGAGNGTGGDDDIVTFGGTATLSDAGNYSDASVQDVAPFKVSGISSSGGYMSVLTTNNSAGGYYGRAYMAPASDANSLDSMTVFTNGHLILRGGLDFFFRSDNDVLANDEFRPVDSDNRTAGGLRLVLHSGGPTTFRLEVIANTGGIYSGGEGGATITSLSHDFYARLYSNTLYHVGLTFDGADDGNVTATVWLKEGSDEIALRQDIPVGSVTFGINESVVTNGFKTGSFKFGNIYCTGAVPSLHEFDCLRVYNDTPQVMAELPVPAAGTVILVR